MPSTYLITLTRAHIGRVEVWPIKSWRHMERKNRVTYHAARNTTWREEIADA